MGLVGHQQVQLGVLLNLHADLIQPLDGCVTGEEVLGPRAEGAQEDHQGVAPGGLHVFNGLEHIFLVLHSDGALVDADTLALAGRRHGGAAELRQVNDEAVPGDGDDAQLYLWNVGQHTNSSLNLVGNVDACTLEADVGSLGSFAGFRMGQQPLVPGGKPLVLPVQGRSSGGGCVSAPGQDHRHSEALGLVDVAGGVVQGSGIDLYRHPGGDEDIALLGLDGLLFAGLI